MHLLRSNGPQKIRHTDVVVEAKSKKLDRLQIRRNPHIGFERALHRSDQILLGLLKLLFGRTGVGELLKLAGAHRLAMLKKRLGVNLDIANVFIEGR